MAYTFKEIVIIYNPNSTGDSETNAKRLAEQLTDRLPRVKTQLLETTHRGHAEEIGAEYARRNVSALLVSSSGDGGYNELINGVLTHGSTNLATCVLPSGNANDHYHATAEELLLQRIVRGETQKIDVLKVVGQRNGQEWHRYAHSYVGIGLTAYIGRKLNQTDLNPINEKWLVLKYILKLRHVTVRRRGERRWKRYRSLVVANINRMSKYVQLSGKSTVTDGEAELYVLRARSILWLIRYVATGIVTGLHLTEQKSSFNYEMKSVRDIQCDGEVFSLDAASEVSVRVQPRTMRIISLTL